MVIICSKSRKRDPKQIEILEQEIKCSRATKLILHTKLNFPSINLFIYFQSSKNCFLLNLNKRKMNEIF